MSAAAAALMLSSSPLYAHAADAQHFRAVIDQIKTEMPIDPALALKRFPDAHLASAREHDPRRRAIMDAEINWLRSEVLIRLGEPARALPLLAQARGAVERIQPRSRLAADILLTQGSALTDTGRVTEALTALQRSHALFLELREARSRSKALVLIALLYLGGRDHAAALRYFAEARDAYGDDPGLLLSIYNGRGITLMEDGRPDEALREFEQALPIAQGLKSEPAVAQVLCNVADAQLRLKRLDRAEQTVRRGLALTRNPGNAAYRPPLLGVAAAIALERGELARAEALIRQRFAGIDLTKTILADRDAHDAAYRLAVAQHRDGAALVHLAALKRLDEQATAIARSNGAALAAARFDYTNQELRIAKLKATDLQKTVAFERATARTQRWMFLGVAVATLLVIALLGAGVITLRRSRNKVRAANADLAVTNVALEKALAAKTAFLATTSHEIRTPLNGILGMTQVMIADASLDAATRDRLSVVHSAGTTMRALVDDILDVAKIETGKMTIENAPMDVQATIVEASRLWRDQAESKGLSFNVVLDDCPTWIIGDATRLRQIIFNLLSNAVKFTAAGDVTLRAGVQGERLRVDVVDSGIGIAPEVLDTIFESFRQADTGTTRLFGGTGLGLSICRNLARAMGGDVTVISREGAGATFTLDLPLRRADVPEGAGAGIALLVIERNPITRAMFKTLFAPLGAAVIVADADEARAWLDVHTAARVLADAAYLDEGDAISLVAAAGDAPVALLTASGDAAMRARWSRIGIADVIERPIGKKDLVERLRVVARPLVHEAA